MNSLLRDVLMKLGVDRQLLFNLRPFTLGSFFSTFTGASLDAFFIAAYSFLFRSRSNNFYLSFCNLASAFCFSRILSARLII